MALLLKFVRAQLNVEEIQKLLDSGHPTNIKYQCRFTGSTALHECFRYRDTDKGLRVMNLLLKYGANINARDRLGQTPLMAFLCRSTNVRLIKTLLWHGADVNVASNDGDTALHYYPLHKANMNPFVFSVLLSRHADINVTNDRGETPLMTFVMNGCGTGYIKALLEAGADIKHANFMGNRVLHFCSVCTIFHSSDRLKQFPIVSHGAVRLDVLEVLIENGAEVDVKNDRGETPLMLFVKNRCSLEHVKCLLNKGVDINDVCSNGYNVLSYFTWNFIMHRPQGPCSDLLKLLLECGVSTGNDSSLVYNFLFYENNNNIKALLNSGVRVYFTDYMSFVLECYYKRQDLIEDINSVFKYLILHDETFSDHHLWLLKTAKHNCSGIENDLNEFKLEVNKLKKYSIRHKLTLYDFLAEVDCKKLGKYFKYFSLDFIENMKTEFPFYYDLIERKVEVASRWHITMSTIDRLSITSKLAYACEKEVELNSDCVLYLTRFLTNYDLLKLVWAAE